MAYSDRGDPLNWFLARTEKAYCLHIVWFLRVKEVRFVVKVRMPSSNV